MKSSNQCVFVSKLFFRLLGTAIAVLIVGGPLHTSSASAASGNTYTGNYVIENSLGRTVVPLPDGTWHKAHEETLHQDSGSGDFVSGVQFQIIYMVQLVDIWVSGVVRISTNKEEHGGGWWKPSNLCYKEKWRYLKQESVSKRNVFCWGVRNNKFRNKPRPDTEWQRAVKKMGEAGWFAPLGIRGIHARYARSDADKILNVGYYFFLTTRMSWLETRDWMRDLKPRIQAGFQGKFLTPHRKPTTSPEPQPPHTARRAISPAVGTSGQENESLIAKARTMQGRPLTGREVQELFTGNTLIYYSIRHFYKNKSTRSVKHRKRGEYDLGWSVKDGGIFCIETYRGSESCRDNIVVEVLGERVFVRMTRMRGRHKGKAFEGQLFPGNQLR